MKFPASDSPLSGSSGRLMLEALAEIQCASQHALEMAIRQRVDAWKSPVAALIRSTARPFELAGSYCLGGELVETLPGSRGIIIPNRFEVPDKGMLRRVLPARQNFLNRTFLETHAYPTWQAVEYYSDFGYSGWMEFPLKLGGVTISKITFMHTRPKPPDRLEMTAMAWDLAPLRMAWLMRQLVEWMRQALTLSSAVTLWEVERRLAEFLSLMGKSPQCCSSKAALNHLRHHALTGRVAKITGLTKNLSSTHPAVAICTSDAISASGLASLLGNVACGIVPTIAVTRTYPDPSAVRVLLVTIDTEFTFDKLALLRSRFPSASLLAVLPTANSTLIRRCLKAGAEGILPRSASPAALLEAVNLLANGSGYHHPDVRSHLDIGANERFLSARECEVLSLAARGEGDKQIADQLGLSIHTVDTHLRKCFRKLNARNRSEAIRNARLRGEIG